MTHQRKPSGRRPGPDYKMADDIPWPELKDGTAYVLHGTGEPYRVQHPDTGDQGTVQWLTWAHPDGSHMKDRTRTMAATKTKPERRITHPGDWFATVSWDRADTFQAPPSQVRLADLLPIAPGA